MNLLRALLLAAIVSGSAVAGGGAAPLTVGTVPDLAFVDQAGNTRHFWTDLAQGHTVVVNFIFTTCTTICPPMGANFAALQHLMSTRGADVRFVSVSIDPTTDTPARLAEWAGRFGGTPAWTLLNGPSASVNAILDALGMRSAVREEHSPVLVMGDTRTGRWTRASALAPPEELADLLDELRGARR